MEAEERFDSLFAWYGKKYHVDAAWLKAQAICESNLDPDAVSPVGAVGLTQFMLRTWEEVAAALWHRPTLRTNPEKAIEAQAYYMAGLGKLFEGDRLKSTAAYNCGQGRLNSILNQWGANWREMIPKETRDYLTRIEAQYARLIKAEG